MALIELEHITFSYDSEEPPVLRDFSLSVEAGECLALRGDNGAGKTTLFRVLNGLSVAQSGTYRFDGETVTPTLLKNQRWAKGFHKRVGYLFQNPDVMLFNASVREEIAFGPRQMGLPEADIRQRVADCMALFDLAPLEDKAPYHLSGGQKKQVALAAVLALNPEVLILDEPLAGLDGGTRTRLVELLRELRQAGKTLLLATHEDALCAALDARVYPLAASEPHVPL